LGGVEIGRIWFEVNREEQVRENSKNKPTWCLLSEIPATWEEEVGVSQSKAGPGKKCENLSEKHLKKKGLRE
jgi:hypothetical protein